MPKRTVDNEISPNSPSSVVELLSDSEVYATPKSKKHKTKSTSSQAVVADTAATFPHKLLNSSKTNKESSGT